MLLSLTALIPLVPLISAFSLPHFTPQDALSAADSFVHGDRVNVGSTTLGHANDITLASIPGDEHISLTHAKHPVRLFTLLFSGII